MNIQKDDILVDSWGYSMQLVDYYKVISTTAKTAKVVEIGSRTESGSDGYSGYCVPEPSIIKSIQEYRVFERNGKWAGGDYYVGKVDGGRKGHLHKWDGKARYFNHLD